MTSVAAPTFTRADIRHMGTGIALVALGFAAAFIALYVRYRGKRIVTCPETHLPVATKVNAALAAGTWMVTQPRFVVTACSRWPERAGCDQACAPQIEADPQATLVRNVVAKWYAERTCAYCSRPISDIRGAVVPALLTMDGALREWRDVAPEELPQVLDNAAAVCATCELVEDFRRRFPDRILERAGAVRRAREPHMMVGEATRAVY
ncbi:MAG: hypothetical protein ACJ74H_17785 [Thermoanaerobaculia bacterium]